MFLLLFPKAFILIKNVRSSGVRSFTFLDDLVVSAEGLELEICFFGVGGWAAQNPDPMSFSWVGRRLGVWRLGGTKSSPHEGGNLELLCLTLVIFLKNESFFTERLVGR